MTTASVGTAAGSRSRTDPIHHNEVLLTGDLLAGAEDRTLADGQEVTSFRLSVRAASPDGTARPAERIDCVCAAPGVRKRVARAAVGEPLEIVGTLRHRYWRSGAALADRYEVVVHECRKARRGP